MSLEMLTYVRKVIEKQYGKNKIKNIEYLSSGRINNIFKVELKDCDVEKVVVRLRYFNDPCFGQRFGTEIMTDDILQDCIKYPKLIAYDSTRELIPKEYSILSFAEGRLFHTYDGSDKFKRLGEIFKTIHTTSVPTKYSKEFLEDIDGYYTRRFESIIKNSKKYDPHVAELIQDAMKYYYCGVYQPSDISLTHHDFHEKNLMVDGNDITVLDWESARVEATEVEFIRAKYYLLNRTSEQNVDAFVEGYGPIGFTDNFFMQEIMWLARISNFERTFPPKDNSEKDFWCSADFLSEQLEELLSKYKERGTYKTVKEIITPQEKNIPNRTNTKKESDER